MFVVLILCIAAALCPIGCAARMVMRSTRNKNEHTVHMTKGTAYGHEPDL
jgi:hypothetical protein